MKFNFRKIASVMASTVMLSSTVALAAAANYPSPFVTSGVADVAVVYGANAAQSDLVAATDITTDLNSKLVAASTGAETTVSANDFLKIEKSSDKLNLGEQLKQVQSTKITSDHLTKLLADGTYRSDDNQDYDYTQYVELAGGLELKHFDDDDYKEDTPTIGIPIADGAAVFNYTLEFNKNPESDVNSNGRLEDFEDTDITILGKTYTLLNAYNSTNKYELMGGAVKDTLAINTNKMYTIGDKSYDVIVSFIDSDEAKFIINGETTNALNVGETFKLADGSQVGVTEVNYQDYAGGIQQVEFTLGANKLTLESGQEVEVDDDEVDNLVAYITKTPATGGKQQLEKIIIEWKTDDEMFITSDSSVTMPGFNSIKLHMTGFTMPKQEMLEIKPSGNTEVELGVMVKDGSYTLPILSGNGTVFNVVGKASDKKLLTTNVNSVVFNDSIHDYLVASWSDGNDAESYILRASVDLNTGSGNKTTLKNLVTGTTSSKFNTGVSFTYGNVELTVNGFPDKDSVNFTINSNGNFNKLYTKEGLEVWLPVDSAAAAGGTTRGNINASATVAANHPTSFIVQMDEENDDEDISAGANFNVTVGWSGNEVTVSSVSDGVYSGGNDFEVGDSDDFVGYVNSSLASKVTYKTGGDQDSVSVEYHGAESYGNVFLADETAYAVSGEEGARVLAVKDSETTTAKNLVVVGGSCINTVAAGLLGGALCGADFEAATGVGAGSFLIQTFARDGGGVATLVAGYNAEDTTNAAKAFTTQTVDTSAGKKYTGTTSTSITSALA